MQFFGDKYGDTVRVLQIGGAPHALERLLDGTVRRHAREIDGRNRAIPNREGRSDRGGNSADRSSCRGRGARLGEAGSGATTGEI